MDVLIKGTVLKPVILTVSGTNMPTIPSEDVKRYKVMECMIIKGKHTHTHTHIHTHTHTHTIKHNNIHCTYIANYLHIVYSYVLYLLSL